MLAGGACPARAVAGDRFVSFWFYRLNTLLRPLALFSGWLGAVDPDGWLRRDGGMLLVANHSSFLDPWFLGAAVPRPVRFVLNARWYHRSRTWRALFDASGVIPVDAVDPRRTIDAIVDAVRAGAVVGVFPEGRITWDGRMGRFRSGIAAMAALSGAPVVPVALRGAFRCLPRTRRIPRPVRVRAHVGSPVTYPGAPLTEPPPLERARAFAARLEAEVRRLLGDADAARARVTDRPPPGPG